MHRRLYGFTLIWAVAFSVPVLCEENEKTTSPSPPMFKLMPDDVFRRPVDNPTASKMSFLCSRVIKVLHLDESIGKFSHGNVVAALGCDIKWSMQHLISNYREGDVDNEVQNEDLSSSV